MPRGLPNRISRLGTVALAASHGIKTEAANQSEMGSVDAPGIRHEGVLAP